MKKKTPIVSTLTLCTSRANWAAFVLSVGFLIMGINLGKHIQFEGTVFYDPEDQWIIDKYSWSLTTNKDGRCYFSTKIDGKKEYLHRMIMGVSGTKMQIDHKFGNTLDCRKENMRVCTQAQNSYNKPPGKKNKTGFKGVSLCIHKTKPYFVYIGHNYKSIWIGRFADIVEAARAYNIKASELYGEFAWLNPV